MAAHAQRVKTSSSYSPYLHNDTYVFLPDGSQQVITVKDPDKSRSKTAKEYAEELRTLIDPWEKESLLEQKESQSTRLWKQTYGEDPLLNVNGLKRPRTRADGTSNVTREWDSFEIAFDSLDVLTAPNAAQIRKDIFDTVVEWAKTIHSPGLEGGARAFTIQDWHGLTDGSSRPHLRLEIHRVGWDTNAQIPQVVQTQTTPVIRGTTLPRMNYGSNESSEVDKDLSVLNSMLKQRFNIELTSGPQSQDKNYMATKRAMDLVRDNTQSVDKTIAALQKEPDMKDFAEQLGLDSSVLNFEKEADGKPYTLRKPTNPMEQTGVSLMNLALQLAQAGTAAMGLSAAQEQIQELNENVRALANEKNDLEVELDTTQNERETLKEEVSQLQLINTTLVEEKTAVEEKVVQQDHKYASAIAELEEKQRAALEQLNAQHAASLKQAAEAHHAAIEKLNAQHNVELATKQGLVESYKKDNDEKTQQNTVLAQEKTALQEQIEKMSQEKSKLEQDFSKVQTESHQHKQAEEASRRILAKALELSESDKLVLNEKIEDVREVTRLFINKLKSDRSGAIFVNTHAGVVSDFSADIKSIIKPSAQYQGRLQAYVQAKLPDPEPSPDNNDAVLAKDAFEVNIGEIDKEDAKYIQKQRNKVLENNDQKPNKIQSQTHDGITRG